MQASSMEWRRLLRNAPGTPVRREEHPAFVRAPVLSRSVGLETLLHTYQQLFLEKERLRSECVRLRRELERKGRQRALVLPDSPRPVANELDQLMEHITHSIHRLHDNLQTLATEVSKLQGTHSSVGTYPEDDAKAQSEILASLDRAARQHAVAKLLERWVFPGATAAQMRLVDDALIRQGILDERV